MPDTFPTVDEWLAKHNYEINPGDISVLKAIIDYKKNWRTNVQPEFQLPEEQKKADPWIQELSERYIFEEGDFLIYGE